MADSFLHLVINQISKAAILFEGSSRFLLKSILPSNANKIKAQKQVTLTIATT
jgi:hypothetical protein